MNTTAWTIEAYLYPTSSPDNEQYFIDFRNSVFPSNSGFAVGIGKYTSTTPNFFRPVVYSDGTGGTAATGTGGATQRPSSGPTNFSLNTWAHIAVVKQANNNSNLYMYLNGQSCGTVNIGTNYTTLTWGQQVIGKLVDVSTFKFYGTIGGIRVSNAALYTTAPFTPPDFFSQVSTTTFLLSNNFKEKVGNRSFVPAGNVTASSFTVSPTSQFVDTLVSGIPWGYDNTKFVIQGAGDGAGKFFTFDSTGLRIGRYCSAGLLMSNLPMSQLVGTTTTPFRQGHSHHTQILPGQPSSNTVHSLCKSSGVQQDM
jgi:hypothetical protein